MKRVAALAAVAFCVACTSIQPLTIQSGDICTRCRQTIETPRIAAETVASSGEALKYRSVKCLATYFVEHPGDRSKTVFVTDYTTGELVNARSALFVWASIESGEQDYLAFSSVNDAVAAGKTHRQAPIDWLQVMSRTEASSTH